MAHRVRQSRQRLEPGEGRSRLFFALWPDHATRALLSSCACALQGECGGRVVPAGNIHLTLVFLGDVAAARLGDLCAAADDIGFSRFALEIGSVHYWRHNRIVWAGPPDCPDVLRGLVSELESALIRLGFEFDRRAYTPHITLLRNAGCAPGMLDSPAVRWSVDGFVLVRSVHRDRGVAYEVLRGWPPGPGTEPAGRVARPG